MSPEQQTEAKAKSIFYLGKSLECFLELLKEPFIDDNLKDGISDLATACQMWLHVIKETNPPYKYRGGRPSHNNNKL